jgi:parallel beta-helix repeat protein
MYITKDPSSAILYSGASATIALQTAFDFAEFGNTVFIEDGYYPIENTLSSYSGINIKGSGSNTSATLDYTNADIKAFGEALRIFGRETLHVDLDSDALEGSNTLSVKDVSGLKADDLIMVKTDKVWKNNERKQKQGELKYILSIDGNEITLKEPLEDTYKLSEDGEISKIELVKNITVSGIRMINTARGKNLQGLSIEYGANIHITNCTFKMMELNSITLVNVINSKVDKNKVFQSFMKGFGYGTVLSYASQNVTVEENEYYENRHAIAIGGGSGAGIPRHITIQRNNSTDSISWNPEMNMFNEGHQYDCHNVGEDINFLYNEATGKGTGFGGVGFYTGLIKGNYLHDLTKNGISIHNPYAEEIVIEDNIIENIGGRGITIGAYSPNYDCPNVIIRNNTIIDTWFSGLTLIGAHNSTIYNNTIIGSSGSEDNGLPVIFIDYSDKVEIYENVLIGRHTNGALPTAGIHVYGARKGRKNGYISIHDNDLTFSGYTPIIDEGINTEIVNNH